MTSENNSTKNSIGQETGEGDKISKVNISNEMKQSYIDYSMSVIAGRALPDVRDGLKPVHRRILYSMDKENIHSHGSHRKSSNIVGSTMGDFHPHGDKSIYDSLVRMSQDFSMRIPLIDGQGNFGSIDGDPPAAMRYTEARMSKPGELLLEDIDKKTVDWSSNYDDRLEEPEVLPAKFPNLLINGSSGIAVGMSTNIPPHNPSEVINACIKLIDNPDSEIEDLMENIKGPDFPTGGEIVGKQGIEKAYKTGKGKITLRASYDIIDEDSSNPKIIIRKIPYQTDKSKLVEKIAKLIDNDEDITKIKDLRDESSMDGIRIVIELKDSSRLKVLENKLLNSVLEQTYSIRNLALVDNEPELLNLKEILNNYINHRKKVVLRKSEFELEQAKKEEHLLEGKIKALDNSKKIVEKIRESKNREEAVSELIENFDLSEKQAQHIVRMQLGSLTSMDYNDIKTDHEKVKNKIEELKNILNNESTLINTIKEELETVKEILNKERKTKISEESTTVSHEELIPEKDSIILFTKEGYIKRTSLDKFNSQKRGGKGVIGISLKEEDTIVEGVQGSTHDEYLMFSNQGNMYKIKGYKIPESGRNTRGEPAINLLPINSNEYIVSAVTVNNYKNKYLNISTENGLVKTTKLEEYDTSRSKLKAIDLKENDQISDVLITDGSNEISLSSKEGRTLIFEEKELSVVGRNSKGIYGMKLNSEKDKLKSISKINENKNYILTLTENGYGKITNIEKYSKTSRNNKGVIDISTGERNGHLVKSDIVKGTEELIIYSEKGKIIRTDITDINEKGRNTKGVKIMNLENEDTLTTFSIL